MKKLSLVLSALLLFGCNSQISSNQLINSNPLQNTIISKKSSLTAKSAYPLALKEAKKTLKAAQLFEIDIWNEGEAEVFHYGFMQKNNNASYRFLRIIVNPESGEISQENLNDNGKVPELVDIEHWKIDYDQVINIARSKGLEDPTYLVTLWEDTWHISGLRQTLYFQLDSQNGNIKMVCTDPYLTSCTDGDNNPVKIKTTNEFQKKRSEN